MLFALGLALQMQSAAPAARPQATPRDSAAKLKLLARARREETILFYEWRWEWEKSRDLMETDSRDWSLHCHAGESLAASDVAHLIATQYSRKSMCPIWFQGYGVTPNDEALAIDNGLRPDARKKIRAKRAVVIALLDSVAVVAADDPWLIGQRVRLNIDQREFERALTLATDHCALADSYCALLVAYALAGSGDRHGADAGYAYAASLMTLKDRCAFFDIRVFLESNDREKYEKLPCPAQDVINKRFWWLADPLFMEAGNERLAVHLHRETLILLHAAVTVDERFDWRVKYGGSAVAEMVLRYGWPATQYWNRIQDDNHFGWLGFRDSSVNASREYFRPRFHTTPAYAVATDLSNLKGPDLADVAPKWNPYREEWDQDWWPVEHFARDGPLATFDYQVASFRRASTALVAFAADPRSTLLPDSMLPRYTAALVAASGPSDSARRAVGPATIRPAGGLVLSVETKPGLQVLSAEVFDAERDSAPAARARFAIIAPPGLDALAPKELAVSDPLLFAAPQSGGDLPKSSADAIDRMRPSTDLRGSPRVGVFFEVYGIAPQEEVDVTLTVSQNEHPGLLRRLGARIGLADLGDGSILLHWHGVQPGMASGTFMIGNTVVQTNAVILDLSRLRPGPYAIEIGVSRPGEPAATSIRQLTIKEK